MAIQLGHVLHLNIHPEQDCPCARRMINVCLHCRCASDGEKQAALYNMACAYAALQQKGSALVCLEGAFDSGFADFNTVRTDPDLDSIRGADLDKLLDK